MDLIHNAYRVLLIGCMIFLSITICFCLFRAIIGPRFTDRVVSVNIICTKTIILIAGLSFVLEEPHLVDIAMVYAMVSFLAVLVLSKCYLLTRHANPLDEGHPIRPELEEEAK